jgi:hypothetical protein
MVYEGKEPVRDALQRICANVAATLATDGARTDSEGNFKATSVNEAKDLLLESIQEVEDRRNFGINSGTCKQWADRIVGAIQSLGDVAKVETLPERTTAMETWLNNLADVHQPWLEAQYKRWGCSPQETAPVQLRWRHESGLDGT